MAASIVKVAIGMATIGGTTGLGYFSYSHLISSTEKQDFKSTVRDLISRSGRTLLTRDSPQWLERWKEYVKDNKNSMDLNGYSSKSKDQNNVPEEFKDRCFSRLNEKILGIEDKLFQDLSTWCVNMTTISDLVTAEGKRVKLNESTGDESEWLASWKNYVANASDNLWELNDWGSVKSNLTSTPTSFKNKCIEKLAEKAFGVKDVKFERVISWCTKDKVVAASGH
ncbi:hypothetical protein MHC_04755 [Mycoplasma haemocanis str. Illinois]|uniref:Uncharacterized protein n=1 Tax=Mycoplasma haemocanis (strain Illinois) TaxID=1111676 RepID=H6N835_MYCHN|nr:hypothetical protein [Mycoplasma haemocanis]AEW45807.1 hypothetical protein MHC_04755 [Mycoplasma haemocanis str. Illinois]